MALEIYMKNLREAWTALRMIREALETLGPVGCLEASEQMSHGPTFIGEATVLVEGIKAMAAALPRDTLRGYIPDPSFSAPCDDEGCPHFGEPHGHVTRRHAPADMCTCGAEQSEVHAVECPARYHPVRDRASRASFWTHLWGWIR